MATIKEHSWTKEDTILTLYWYKFGLRYLGVSSDNYLAENYIGSSVSSMKMQAENLNYLLCLKTNSELLGLSKFKTVQEEVINSFGFTPEIELRKICHKILDNISIEDNQLIAKQKKDHNQLNKQFRELGFDPNKMKLIAIRIK